MKSTSTSSSTRALAPPSKGAAALLAAAWCLPASIFAGMVAGQFGFWADARPAVFLLGTPAVLLVGRVAFWGWLPAFFFGELKLTILSTVALAGDLVFLRFIGITPRPSALFWIVEVLTILFCLVPAQEFARWTRDNRRLTARNILHVLFHAALILGVWPLLAVELFGGNWHAWAERSSALNKIYLQILCIPGVILLTAMQEFHAQGRGTPMPEDAPRTLVTTGIYAYVANPMQIGKFAILAGWGCFWKNPYIVAVAFLGLLYSFTIARWHEDRDLTARFGAGWIIYRRNVRRWLPRWRPWIAPSPENASQACLYLDSGCGPCSQLLRWFLSRQPVGLRICALADYPGELPTRITYRCVNSTVEQHGVAAVARALEHLHLAWAFCGWMLRLPVVRWIAQLIADAVNPSSAANCQTNVRADDLASAGARLSTGHAT